MFCHYTQNLQKYQKKKKNTSYVLQGLNEDFTVRIRKRGMQKGADGWDDERGEENEASEIPAKDIKINNEQ